MARDKSEYYQKYYEENRELINQRRREKYAQDKDYAQTVLDRGEAHRLRKMAQHKSGVSLTEGRPRKPVTVKVQGRDLAAYSIGHLAREINRQKSTINHWTQHGMMPVTPIRGNGGTRLYTEGMMMVVNSAVQSRGEISQKDETFRQEIVEGWAELGIVVD